MDRDVTYEPGFYDDLCWWRDEDPDTGRRVVDLIEFVIGRPKEGPGRPKKLAGLPGVWSRRITKTHRLFYVIDADGLHFISCLGHELAPHLKQLIREGRW